MIRCVAFAVLVLAVVITVGEKTTDVEVQGTRGGSIQLAPMIPEGFNTRDVYWRHMAMGEHLVASVSRGYPETTYQSRFLGRAHLHRGFTLEIRDLEVEDTGVFTCMLVSLEGQMLSMKYHVIVYEAVVQPTVQVFVSGGPKECSVFLRCNSSMGNNVSYTWRATTRQGDPVNTSYTLYNEGRLLITTLRPENSGASYTCIVANPVSHENVTVVPWESCVSLSEAAAPATMQVFVSGGPNECSVFLRCNSMTGNNVSYTWSANTRQGNPVNTSYSLYDEGRLLTATIRPEHMEASYTCTVANHVSQQNITVVPWESCLSLSGKPPKTQSYQQILCMASAIALAFVSLMICVLLLVKTSGLRSCSVQLANLDLVFQKTEPFTV
uniref:Ig-like domain-containing protein n=1 Tax=Leptobrachium leishanense TaxID=445787 RepID=A0A8C5MS22_9ANUR